MSDGRKGGKRVRGNKGKKEEEIKGLMEKRGRERRT